MLSRYEGSIKGLIEPYYTTTQLEAQNVDMLSSFARVQGEVARMEERESVLQVTYHVC